MNILITGGAGFIGSNLCHYLINSTSHNIHVIDSLTYAGNLISIEGISDSSRFEFSHVDILDKEKIKNIYEKFLPDAVMHLAAESHVDRSIYSFNEFIKTNILGTINLLEISFEYWESLKAHKKNEFKFHHISTDEVYGSLGKDGYFKETTPYDPSSPYSASKASSDHFVRVWNRTYGLPTIITNCSNNYGPYQNKEKLIPMIITNALHGKEITIYGDGNNIRDWLYVEDHVEALYTVLINSYPGKTYNIGGNYEMTNNQVVQKICELLELSISADKRSHKFIDLIKYTSDRKGHDKRYAIDSTLLKKELHWQPRETFDTGIKKTIEWYLNNMDWVNKTSKN